MSELKLAHQAAESLKRWHEMIARRDPSALAEILDDAVVFRSPVAHHPYSGVLVVSTILTTVLQVFEDFTYHRELIAPGGLDIALEFSARVGDRRLKGIDLIRFDDRGKIVDFEVMVRPMSGLQALAEEMGRRLAPYLAASKP